MSYLAVGLDTARRERCDQSGRRNDNNSSKQRRGTTPNFVTASHELASRFSNRKSNGSEIINVRDFHRVFNTTFPLDLSGFRVWSLKLSIK